MPANVSIVITAKDQASGVLKGVSSTLGSIAKVAAGIGAAAVGGFAIMGKAALDATADYEKLTLQLESLAARELINADASLTMADAYKMASGNAQELLKWSQELAIQSPFDQETIANSLQQAMNYGFTAEESQRLTENLVDMGSAMGFTSDKMGLVSYALGQIHASDKLLTQDLRQLINAGVPVNDILAEMGFTLADVGKEAISSADFLEEFNKMAETDFAGAGARMTKSWSGMLSTFQDIKKMGLRTLFADTFAVLQPLVGTLQDWLLGPGLAKLEEWGAAMGDLTQNIVDLFTGAKKLDMSDMTAGFANWAESIDWAGLSKGLAEKIKSIDWVAIGAEIRTSAINIFNGLSTIVSEIDWQALTDSLGTALQGVVAGLYGYVSWEALATDFNNGLASLFGYAGAGAFEQLKTDFANGFAFIAGIITTSIEGWKAIIQGFVDFFLTTLTGIITIASTVFIGLVGVVQTILTILKSVIQTALNGVTAIFGKTAGDWMSNLAQGILSGIGRVINAIKKMVTGINNALSAIVMPDIFGGGVPKPKPSGSGASASGLGGASGGVSTNNNGVPAFAGGGIMSAPSSGGLALLHGTEGVFTREQMAMLSPAGGGGITINLTYAPAFSTANADELQYNLMPLILQGVKQARRGS